MPHTMAHVARRTVCPPFGRILPYDREIESGSAMIVAHHELGFKAAAGALIVR